MANTENMKLPENDPLRYHVFADGDDVAEFAEEKDAKWWAVSLTFNYHEVEVYDLVKEAVIYTVYDDGEEYEIQTSKGGFNYD